MFKGLMTAFVGVLSIGTAFGHPGHDHATTVHQPHDIHGGLIEQGLMAAAVIAVIAGAAYVLRRNRPDGAQRISRSD